MVRPKSRQSAMETPIPQPSAAMPDRKARRAIDGRAASGRWAVTAPSHAEQQSPDGAAGAGGDRPARQRRDRRHRQAEQHHRQQKSEALPAEPTHPPGADGSPRPTEASQNRHERRPTESMQKQVRRRRARPAEQIGRLRIGRVVERRVARIEAGERQEQHQSGAEQSETAHVRHTPLQIVDRPHGEDRKRPGSDHDGARPTH